MGDAFIDEDENRLVFGLQIKADADGTILQGNNPHFNSEILLKIKPNKIKRWQDISGKIIEWKDYPYDENEPHALLYVFEHEPIYNAKIEFKNTNEKIIVKVQSLCDINLDDEYSDNLSLEIETELKFHGILCGKDITEDECKNKIKPYLEIDELKYVKK